MSKRPATRPYFFEIFALANVALIAALLWPIRGPLTMLPRVLWSAVLGFLLQVAAGVGVRALVAWRRRRLRSYLTVIRSRQWLADTLRLAVASALFLHAYAWIKLAIPLLHPRLFDQELCHLDATI